MAEYDAVIREDLSGEAWDTDILDDEAKARARALLAVLDLCDEADSEGNATPNLFTVRRFVR